MPVRRKPFRPRPGARRVSWAPVAILLAIAASVSSCALFEAEESLSPSPTITVPAAIAPSPTAGADRPSPTTAAALPETTTTTAATTTTDPSVGSALRYLEQLLSTEAGFSELAESVGAINDDWDDRSRTGVSFSDTASALEAAAGRALSLQDFFGLIEPPAEIGLGQEHRTAAAAVAIMADTSQEMLDGLRSTDTGQARQAAVVGFLTAFDLLGEVIAQVAAVIGEEGEALLAAGPTFAPPPVTDVPETVPTTVAAEAPPNPGNTKNCSDFSTQAEAQEWFDAYFPFYGDVALMDTNGNRVACETLP